jgi:hypothetical protein
VTPSSAFGPCLGCYGNLFRYGCCNRCEILHRLWSHGRNVCAVLTPIIKESAINECCAKRRGYFPGLIIGTPR